MAKQVAKHYERIESNLAWKNSISRPICGQKPANPRRIKIVPIDGSKPFNRVISKRRLCHHFGLWNNPQTA